MYLRLRRFSASQEDKYRDKIKIKIRRGCLIISEQLEQTSVLELSLTQRVSEDHKMVTECELSI